VLVEPVVVLVELVVVVGVLVVLVTVDDVIAGKTGADMTDVGLDVATLEPFLLLAVIVTRIVEPTSAATRMYA
jgi:hypothetical protein